MSRGQKKFAVDKKISDSDIVSLAHEVLSSTVETLPGVEFEKKTVTIALNGYPTQKPEGKRAQTIDLDILRSSIESDVKSAIETELQRLFPHVQTHWHSHTRAALETLRSNSKSARDCTIIDVGSLSTTILSIRKGLIVESIDVPLGSQEICTRIAHKGMPEEVRAFLRMIEHDQCTSEACSAVVSAIALFEPEMVRTFGEACAKLTSQRRLPNVAYILSDPDLSPWLSRFFERIDFNQFTTTTRAFLVTRFDAKNAGSNIEYGPSVTPDDSMLLAGALVHTGEDGQ